MPVSFKSRFPTDRKKPKKRYTSTFFSLSSINVLILFTAFILLDIKKGSFDSEKYSDPHSDIWVEVSEIPPHTENYNKLRIPDHNFIRKELLTECPVVNFGKKRHR